MCSGTSVVKALLRQTRELDLERLVEVVAWACRRYHFTAGSGSADERQQAPVMDYRKLNAFVECHTADDMMAVCVNKIRTWQQLRSKLKAVDLKSTYLQIHIFKDL